jgi:hypothetical protein
MPWPDCDALRRKAKYAVSDGSGAGGRSPEGANTGASTGNDNRWVPYCAQYSIGIFSRWFRLHERWGTGALAHFSETRRIPASIFARLALS